MTERDFITLLHSFFGRSLILEFDDCSCVHDTSTFCYSNEITFYPRYMYPMFSLHTHKFLPHYLPLFNNHINKHNKKLSCSLVFSIFLCFRLLFLHLLFSLGEITGAFFLLPKSHAWQHCF